jgi:pantothenate kinase
VCLQIAYEVATSHGLQRVLFGGFFIRANGFTMETITFALDFWSKASRIPAYRAPLSAGCSPSVAPHVD